jgi:hypothetical protein
MSVVVVISQHLLNVFVQLANKRGLKKKNFLITDMRTSADSQIGGCSVALGSGQNLPNQGKSRLYNVEFGFSKYFISEFLTFDFG